MASQASRKKNYTPNWSSGLPDEILENISKIHLSPIDRTIFRSICDSWRSVLPSLRFPPLLMFPFNPRNDELLFYNLCDKSIITLHLPEAHNKVKCGSSHGFLALMDETGLVSVINPFTKFQINLPPVDEKIASTSFYEYEVIKHDGRWMMKYDFDAAPSPLTKFELTKVFFKEIILLSPPKYDGDNFVAVGMLGCSDQIAFCKKGESTWTLLDTMLSCNIRSIACYQHKIFLMDYVGDMSVCNISNHGMATLLPNMNVPPDSHQWNLVAANDGLFLVARALVFDPNVDEDMVALEYQTVVYRAELNTEEPSWCKVESIGSELTLFVSECSSPNFLGRNISGCEGGCIYFSDLLYNNGAEGENGVRSIEVVHLADGTGTTEIVRTCQGQWQHTDVVSWFRPNLLLVKK